VNRGNLLSYLYRCGYKLVRSKLLLINHTHTYTRDKRRGYGYRSSLPRRRDVAKQRLPSSATVVTRTMSERCARQRCQSALRFTDVFYRLQHRMTDGATEKWATGKIGGNTHDWKTWEYDYWKADMQLFMLVSL